MSLASACSISLRIRTSTGSTRSSSICPSCRSAMRAAESGRRSDVARADRMLSEAFLRYVSDLRRVGPSSEWQFVDREAAPAAPSVSALLREAAATGSLDDFLDHDAVDARKLCRACGARSPRPRRAAIASARRGCASTWSGCACFRRAATAMCWSIPRRSGSTCTRTARWSTRCGSWSASRRSRRR